MQIFTWKLKGQNEQVPLYRGSTVHIMLVMSCYRGERYVGIEAYLVICVCRQCEEAKVMREQEFEALRLRQKVELCSKEDRLAAQHQAWQENLLSKQAAETMTKEREMRTKLREERDKVC